MPRSADEIRAIARRYNAASGANDAETMAAMSAPDAVVWHNFDDKEVTADEAAKTLAWVHRTVPDVVWEETALLVTDRGWVWQAVITGDAPGGPLRANTCVVVTLDDEGRIVRTDEYLDPAQLANLRARRDSSP